MSFTLTTSFAMVRRAGANASTAATTSSAFLNDCSDEAEAIICDTARYDVVTNYNNLTANGKKIMQNIANCIGAMLIIEYDPSGYTSRQEVDTMLNVLYDYKEKGLNMIKEDNVKRFLAIN